MGNRPGITVVKIGGSYAGSPELRGWLDAVAACTGHVVLVPGGGPFADTVRETQRTMGLDDGAAHHMALVAMEQYGRALASLGKGLVGAASLAAIRRTLGKRNVPVWEPARMVLAANVPCSWDVTADSLAAWLAGRLRATQVLLVKQSTPAGASISARDLVARGIVDPQFPKFLAASGAAASVAGPADHARAAAAILKGSPCGIRIHGSEAGNDRRRSFAS
jgi:5-(aminomethyl)-3-furanmethanol phosphate kinase